MQNWSIVPHQISQKFRDPGRAVPGIFVVLYAFFVFSPAAGILGTFLSAISGGNFGVLAQMMPTGRTLSLLLTSTLYATAVAGTGMALGIMVATFLSRMQRRFMLGSIVFLVACTPIPPYIHALAWNNALAAVNALLAGAGSPPLVLAGWIIAWWVQVMALLPFACLLCIIAINSVSRELLEVAQLHNADRSVFARVLVPLSMPVLGAGFGFLFLLSIVDYSVPSLFSADTYALDIFAGFSATGSPAAAFAASIPLLMVTTLVLIQSQSGIRALGEHPGSFGGGEFPLKEWPTWFLAFQGGAVLILCLQVLVLLSGVGVGSGSLAAITGTIGSSGPEIFFSLMVALLSAVVTIPLAFGVATILPKEGLLRPVSWLLVTLPLAIPAPLTGIGMIAFWGPWISRPVFSGALLPVCAAVARFAPIAVIIISAQIHMVDRTLMEAATIFSRSRVSSLIHVMVPLVAPGIVIATAFVFSLTLGELGATLLVAPPGYATLTMKIYNYLHYGSFSGVTGLCAVLAGITVTGVLAGLGCIWLWKKTYAHGGGIHD